MYRTIFTLFLACSAMLYLGAQTSLNPNDIDESKRKITPLDNGKYEIKEFTYNDVLVYTGELSSEDPMVRDGSYSFFDSDSNIIATGKYVDDIPVGEWIYFDTHRNTLKVVNYNSVWEYIGNEDWIVAYDTAAMENLSKRYRKLMKEDGTFEEVDELPMYKGRVFLYSFAQHVKESLISPVFAQKNNITDNVIIEFTIDYTGNVSNIQAFQSSSNDLSMEAIRVILASRESWEPAKVNNTPVNVRLSWEFEFHDARTYNLEWYEPPLFSEDSTYLQEFPHDTTLFYIVEDMPLFNNGKPEIEFRKFIATELRYPLEASENGIVGRVIVQFKVNARGVVCDPVIFRGAHPLLDAEAIRVVMSSPRWKPGMQRGKPVSVLYTFPINFTLN